MSAALYKVHCKTASCAKLLLGIRGENVVTKNGTYAHEALYTFRAFPQYRSAASKKLRQDVADIMRAERRNKDAHGEW